MEAMKKKIQHHWLGLIGLALLAGVAMVASAEPLLWVPGWAAGLGATLIVLAVVIKKLPPPPQDAS